MRTLATVIVLLILFECKPTPTPPRPKEGRALFGGQQIGRENQPKKAKNFEAKPLQRSAPSSGNPNPFSRASRPSKRTNPNSPFPQGLPSDCNVLEDAQSKALYRDYRYLHERAGTCERELEKFSPASMKKNIQKWDQKISELRQNYANLIAKKDGVIFQLKKRIAEEGEEALRKKVAMLRAQVEKAKAEHVCK